ncbi:MAG: hypothetical protein M1812_002872 [Candelaria pacifica]|nr:MAG: hypothetical protein M1812_002872 [Candelaria pacifica]
MVAAISQHDIPPTGAGDGEVEDDYMSMTITEPSKPKHEKETYSQRCIRREREAEIRGRTKSKKEREADEAAARDAALSTSLSTSNKGFQMMAKLGFKPGSALGKNEDARIEPLGVVLKEDRGGVGLDSERKRKFREEVEDQSKRVKAEEVDYRERVRLEREAKRLEGQVVGAQKVAERLDTAEEEKSILEQDATAESIPAQEGEGIKGEGEGQPSLAGIKKKAKAKPLAQINVLWRGLLRQRIEKERERRMRYDLHQSLSRLPSYNDPDEDKDDELALGKDNKHEVLEEDVEEEDPELEEFEAREPAERLQLLVQYLRDSHHYCFWCKYQYSASNLDGCPGVMEEDHD